MTITPDVRQASRAWVRDWSHLGRCISADPDALFAEGKELRLAKSVCRTCPVVAECLAEALDQRAEFGVWGGMTPRERRALLRRRPDVVNWAAYLAAIKQGQGPDLN